MQNQLIASLLSLCESPPPFSIFFPPQNIHGLLYHILMCLLSICGEEEKGHMGVGKPGRPVSWQWWKEGGKGDRMWVSMLHEISGEGQRHTLSD